MWLLEELDIDYNIKKFDRPLDKRPVGLKETHIQGHAPQLILPDGRVITQMSACMLYLLLTYDTEQRFHKTDAEYRIREDYLVSLAIADIISRVGTKHLFMVLGVQTPFFMRPFARMLGYGLNKMFLDDEVNNAFHVVEMELEGREWLMGGDMPSRADFAIKVALDLAVHPKLVDLAKWPRMKAWRERCESRPAWLRSLDNGLGYEIDWVGRVKKGQQSKLYALQWPMITIAGVVLSYYVLFGIR